MNVRDRGQTLSRKGNKIFPNEQRTRNGPGFFFFFWFRFGVMQSAVASRSVCNDRFPRKYQPADVDEMGQGRAGSVDQLVSGKHVFLTFNKLLETHAIFLRIR